MLAWKEILYPELRSFPLKEREEAVRRAADTPLDAMELIGMAAGMVVVTAITSYGGLDLDGDQRFSAAAVNFLLAIPLLLLALGPFHVRRLRRGLRAEIDGSRQSSPRHRKP